MDFIFTTRRSLVAISFLIITLSLIISVVPFSFITTNHGRFFPSTFNQANAKKATVLKFKAPSTPLGLLKHKAISITSNRSHHKHSSSQTSVPSGIVTNGSINKNGNNGTKLVMINFDDSFKNQFLYAKPILDKYGFKATFFEVCGWIGKSSERKSWQDIAALQQDGMDIESHTMTHPNLNTMSSLPGALDYQIGGAKQCFLDHGINTPIFAYPYSQGWDNPAIVSTVAKFYSLARTDTGFPVTFLLCVCWKHYQMVDYWNYYSVVNLTFEIR